MKSGSNRMGRSFEEERQRLVEELRREGYVKSDRVAKALLKVPREEFVLPKYRRYAYLDMPLPILSGQTISAPHMCAIMCEELELREGLKVLEVGTGSGYHAALCAEIVAPRGGGGYVCSIEYFRELASFSKRNLRRAGYDDRVSVINGDGSSLLPFRDEFDRILVTAAAPKIPPKLMECLKPGGIMVIPIGTSLLQTLKVVIKENIEKYIVRERGSCCFVKLRGLEGFAD